MQRGPGASAGRSGQAGGGTPDLAPRLPSSLLPVPPDQRAREAHQAAAGVVAVSLPSPRVWPERAENNQARPSCCHSASVLVLSSLKKLRPPTTRTLNIASLRGDRVQSCSFLETKASRVQGNQESETKKQ